ncbi:uncharacterized protein LOC143038547 isoform X1 [Oratosquilla oratoria]|uniref:uncharacterized protein LOC143038547 isoform X1 n=1 Tax=Oratosquilla oratoria TaxID=337810 RepID=UPI003F75823F
MPMLMLAFNCHRMYVIVAFTNNNTVEMVPSGWILGQDETWWPKSKSLTAITKMIKDRVVPDHTWERHKMRVICAADTYEDGRRKAREAEETDNPVSQGEEEVGRGARRIRSRYPPSSDEEEDYVPKAKRKLAKAPAIQKMPSVVSVNIPQFDTFDDAAGVSDILIDTSSLAPTSTPIRVSTAPVSTAPVSSGIMFDNAGGVSDILIHTSSLAPTSTPIRASTAPVSTAPVNSARDVEFLTILMELKHDLEELRAEVRACRAELQKLNKTSGKVDDAELPMQLPLTSLEEFDVFEGWLNEDKKHQKILENKLCLIGGFDLRDCVRRMGSSLLSHLLQVKFNWIGTKGWKSKDDVEAKRGFKSTTLSTVWIGAILRLTCIEGAVQAHVEREIMIYLRNASDRCGGRKRREQDSATSV